MNTTEKETKLLYIQLYASIVFIITTIISTILTYNNIKKNENDTSLFNDNEESEITLVNRIIITILVIVFTYINYEFYKISKIKNRSNLGEKEFIASILALISGLILLYTTIKSIEKDVQNINQNTPIF